MSLFSSKLSKSKILFLFPYPVGESPSQRFRFEQYLDKLKEAGIEFDLAPFWGNNAWSSLYRPGNFLPKAGGVLLGVFRRLILLTRLSRYGFVFIHREALPLGPPIIEWFIARVFKKRIIYDFDDAIWLPNTSEENSIIASLKWHTKVKAICRWSYKVSCGNSYLADFARQYNPSVVVNPSTIDTDGLHVPFGSQTNSPDASIVIGWTGTHSTLKYLDPLILVFQKLELIYPQVKLMVIADKKPSWDIRSLVFVPWNKENEIKDLMRLDIGIMPLADDEWTRGKCGFKALQYMALEKPAIVSPVGVNKVIIDDGINGFLCTTPDDWFARLKELIEQPSLRQQMGRLGREKVKDYYSVSSNASTFLSLVV